MLKQTPVTRRSASGKMKNALTLAKLTWQPRLYDPNLRKWLHRIDMPDADRVG